MISRWRLACVGAAILTALLSGGVSAAPVRDEPWELAQPDGTLVPVRIWGDEFHQVVESLDGYTLVRDPKTQIICYAQLTVEGRLESTGVRAAETCPGGLDIAPHLRAETDWVRSQVAAARAKLAPPRRPKSLAPTLGDVHGICLIVDFPDRVGTIAASEVNNFCNQPGYTGYSNNGSVYDYYYAVSNGLFRYTNYVPAAYYRALNNKTYYDNPLRPPGAGASELVNEALAALETAGFDFSQYDANGDTLIDAVNCFYAGSTTAGWGKGLWPHSGPLLPPFEADGMMAVQYQVTGMGSSLRIGTFCHENGHLVMWWPDLYDYDTGSADSAGIGYFCLMASGNFGANPVQPCAYLKADAGWAVPEVLSGLARTGVAAPATGNVTYRYDNPASPYEFYLIENRQKTGRDANLPDSGLAIWHVDTHGNNSFNEMTPDYHFLVTLVQADGRWDLEHDANSGDTTDLWKAPTYTQCAPLTIPDSDWWDGSSSNLDISNISAAGATMTFDYGGVGLSNEDFDSDGISDLCETRDWDPRTPGVQNPFDPFDGDTTGDNFLHDPDSLIDGDNDYDGDGLTNAQESALGSNPMDPNSRLPAGTLAGSALLAVILAGYAAIRRHRPADRKPCVR